MCSGNEFHAEGPVCEKARSANLVRSAAVVRSQSTTLTSDDDPMRPAIINSFTACTVVQAVV